MFHVLAPSERFIKLSCGKRTAVPPCLKILVMVSGAGHAGLYRQAHLADHFTSIGNMGFAVV